MPCIPLHIYIYIHIYMYILLRAYIGYLNPKPEIHPQPSTLNRFPAKNQGGCLRDGSVVLAAREQTHKGNKGAPLLLLLSDFFRV